MLPSATLYCFLVHVRLSALSVMYAGFYAYHHISLYLFMHVRAVR